MIKKLLFFCGFSLLYAAQGPYAETPSTGPYTTAAPATIPYAEAPSTGPYATTATVSFPDEEDFQKTVVATSLDVMALGESDAAEGGIKSVYWKPYWKAVNELSSKSERRLAALQALMVSTNNLQDLAEYWAGLLLNVGAFGPVAEKRKELIDLISKKDLFETTLQEGASLDKLLEEIFKDEELTEAESKQLHNATVDEVLKKLAEKDPVVKLLLYRRYLQVFEDILQDLFEKEKNKIENKKWFQNWQELKQGNLKDFQSGWQKFKKGLFKSLNVVGKGFAAIGNAIGAIYTVIVCS